MKDVNLTPQNQVVDSDIGENVSNVQIKESAKNEVEK